MERDQRSKNWSDPTHSRTAVAEWVTAWFAVLDLEPRSIDNYRSVLRRHILPLGRHITGCGDVLQSCDDVHYQER